MYKLVYTAGKVMITNEKVKPLLEVILSLKDHEDWHLYKDDKLLLESREMGHSWLHQKRV